MARSSLRIALLLLLVPAWGCGSSQDSKPSPDGGMGGSSTTGGGGSGGSSTTGGGGSGGSSTTGGGGGGDSPWRNVQIVGGGFIPGIIFNPKQKGLVYARTDIGGVYRLDTTTQRWVPLLDWVGFDDWNLTGAESLATDPVDPNRLYVAAGTYTNDWASTNGAILRSTDQGHTFQRTDLPFKLGGNMPGRSMGERLAIDPNDDSVLFFGARSGNGLWKSTDFGVTWSRVSSFTATGNWADSYFKDPIGVVWVTFDPSTGKPSSPTKTIYVGVADTQSSIYRSTDGGATWAAVPGQPTAGYLPHHGVLSEKGMLYVTYSDTAGPYDGGKGDVWKYDTAKSTWTNISPIPSTSTDDYFGYGGLAVDAQHPDTLVVSTLNSWWPDAILYRSTDGGTTWRGIWEFTSYPTRTFRYTQDISAAPWLDWHATPAPPEINPKLGWMIGDIEIDPFNSDRMMYGTGATLYGTDNLTAWDTAAGQVDITVKAQGLEETAVIDLISPPSGAELLSGLGDINGFRHDDVTQVPKTIMTSPTFATCTSLDFAELTPSFIVRVGNADTANGVKGAGFSYDGGTSWFSANNQPNLTGGGTVAAAADASVVVWSPAGGVVSYSKDNGNSWTASSAIPAEARVGSDRVNPKTFYGSSGGAFFISKDGGATFAATTATGLPEGSARFKAVPGHEGDIWLAGGSTNKAYGLWHSTDSGASFTRLDNVQEADVIGFGKEAPGQTYVALYTSAKINNVRGLYRSDDSGATWVRLNDDQHQFGATSTAITGDPRTYGRVYVGTNGRGILYRDLNSK